MLESGGEFFRFFLRGDVFRFFKRLYPERCFFADQLLVDLVDHLIDDLQMPLGSAAEAVVQHPVLFGEIKQLEAEASIHLLQAVMLMQNDQRSPTVPPYARIRNPKSRDLNGALIALSRALFFSQSLTASSTAWDILMSSSTAATLTDLMTSWSMMISTCFFLWAHEIGSYCLYFSVGVASQVQVVGNSRQCHG